MRVARIVCTIIFSLRLRSAFHIVCGTYTVLYSLHFCVLVHVYILYKQCNIYILVFHCSLFRCVSANVCSHASFSFLPKRSHFDNDQINFVLGYFDQSF